VTGDYTQPIQQVITLLTDAILVQEPDLRKTSLDVDQDVRDLLRQVGLGIVQGILGALSIQVTVEAAHSGLAVQRRDSITVDSLFGSVSVESPYLWQPGASARPVKTELGLTHRQRSTAVERALTGFGAEESFAQAVARFQEHYGWTVGRTSALRIVERCAAEAETYVAERLAQEARAYDKPLSERPGIPEILTELDGSTVRTGTLVAMDTADKTPVRQLPRRKRVEEWRDVRVGLTHPLEEVESSYVARMDSYPEVVTQLFGAAVSRGMSRSTTVVAIGDGGHGLREELARQFPNFHYIYDRPHLKKHLYETAEAMGLETAAREAWVARIVDRLDGGGAAEVLGELEAYQGQGKKRVEQLHKHLSRFADAVHYEDYRSRGWPMGSGRVESAHRYIPQKRLKLPGACWNPKTVNLMLALRVLRANGWWEDFWATRSRAQAA